MSASHVQGLPCKRCKETLRYARNNTCVRCALAYSRAEYLAFQDERKLGSKDWHEANRASHNDAMRAGQLKRKFGLTVAQYEMMAEKQGNACAICREPCPTGRKLAVDHCHATGRIRGLLCQGCNTGLGKFRDNPDRLTAAVRYLQSK
jgi:hypothetical protein